MEQEGCSQQGPGVLPILDTCRHLGSAGPEAAPASSSADVRDFCEAGVGSPSDFKSKDVRGLLLPPGPFLLPWSLLFQLTPSQTGPDGASPYLCRFIGLLPHRYVSLYLNFWVSL